VWVDRHNRRRLLLLSNSIRGASIALLTIVSAIYGFNLLAVIIIAIVWSAVSELYRSTNFSILPEIVDAEELPAANGLTQAGSSLLGSASNALGGALVAFAGAVSALFYSTVGYVAATAFSVLIASRSVTPAASENGTRKREMFVEIREGFAWLISQRGLFLLSLSATFFNFFLGIASYFLVVYVGAGLNSGAFVFGGLFALNVLGNAIGSLLAGRTEFLASAGKAWVLAGIISGPLVLVLGVLPRPSVAAVALLAIGLVFGFGNNLWLTSAQNLVPHRMRGRYFAVDGLLSFVGGPPSIVVGGILITVIGIVPVYELVGVLLFVSALGFALAKSLWTLDGSHVVSSG
jgi:Na+/melibiose symporter-like transporter